jgi:GNAT superfamily N-acetyltransferase
LALDLPVVVSLKITSNWFDAPSGRIPPLSSRDKAEGAHTVLLTGYDDERQEFDFRNSWGADWGDYGYGHIPFEVFRDSWIEGWMGGFEDWLLNFPKPELPREVENPVIERRWAVREHGGGIFHARELLRAADTEPIGWSFAVERGTFVEIEELFVRPSFRRLGYGRWLLRLMRELADELQAEMRMWVPFPDADLNNLEIVQRLIMPFGLEAPSYRPTTSTETGRFLGGKQVWLSQA